MKNPTGYDYSCVCVGVDFLIDNFALSVAYKAYSFLFATAEGFSTRAMWTWAVLVQTWPPGLVGMQST